MQSVLFRVCAEFFGDLQEQTEKGIGEASKTLQESSGNDAERRRRKIALKRRERDTLLGFRRERDSTSVLCLKGGDCEFSSAKL
ncbi:hypothetical protein F2Q68_00035366 [Brassica cretica]|uniref:Uncharacterized protein n=1 Tax=Brassica cretica TaxID=69181 RepID=A0A8S9H9A4_BRACR|nr:hypothetical protein F2Q68_00035366 [Brassica cretica]